MIRIEQHRESDLSSIWSEWSTNYTTSNLPGPGRNLGNWFGVAGASLEQNLAKLAYHAELRRRKKARRTLQVLPRNSSIWKWEEEDARMCKVLLGFARSEARAVQCMAFREIIDRIVRLPRLRLVFQVYCGSREGNIQLTIFSWKRPGVLHDAEWLYHYSIASLCLTNNSVMDAIEKIGTWYRLPDIPEYKDLFTSCSDSFELQLALNFFCSSSSFSGDMVRLITYWTTINYDPDVLLRLAFAIRSRFALANSDSGSPELRSAKDVDFDRLVYLFVLEMWQSLRSLDTGDSDSISDDNGQLVLWSAIYEIYSASRSETGRLVTPASFTKHYRGWKEECERWLPDQKHAALRDRLVQLEVDVPSHVDAFSH